MVLVVSDGRDLVAGVTAGKFLSCPSDCVSAGIMVADDVNKNMN